MKKLLFLIPVLLICNFAHAQFFRDMYVDHIYPLRNVSDSVIKMTADTFDLTGNMKVSGSVIIANPSSSINLGGSIEIGGTLSAGDSMLVGGPAIFDGTTNFTGSVGLTTLSFDSLFIGSDRFISGSINDKTVNIGFYAGWGNSETYQTALGMKAGYNNSGRYQTATGYQAGYNNQGTRQTAYGYGAGSGNTASMQIALGDWAGESNQGSNQLAIGSSAGYNNTAAYQIAVGSASGTGNLGGYQIAFGYQAGYGNAGNDQTAIGYQAGYGNTGQNKISIGYSAGFGSIGDRSICIGDNAGRLNSGAKNIALGYYSGATITGDSNIFIGSWAGYLSTGNNCTFIGSHAGEGNNANNVYAFGDSAAFANTLSDMFYFGKGDSASAPIVIIGNTRIRLNIPTHINTATIDNLSTQIIDVSDSMYCENIKRNEADSGMISFPGNNAVTISTDNYNLSTSYIMLGRPFIYLEQYGGDSLDNYMYFEGDNGIDMYSGNSNTNLNTELILKPDGIKLTGNVTIDDTLTVGYIAPSNVLSYYSYVALLDQSGENAPTATVLYCDFPDTATYDVHFVYSAVGQYQIHYENGSVNKSKTVVFFTNAHYPLVSYVANPTAANFVDIFTYDFSVANTYVDEKLDDASIEIRIYK
jgi:hypothetical protein